MVGGGAAEEKNSISHPVVQEMILSQDVLSNLARAWRLLGFGPDPKGLRSFQVHTFVYTVIT